MYSNPAGYEGYMGLEHGSPDVRDEVHWRLKERLFGADHNGAFSLQAEAFAVRGRRDE